MKHLPQERKRYKTLIKNEKKNPRIYHPVLIDVLANSPGLHLLPCMQL